MSNPTGRMSPDVCNNSIPPPVSSPGTPVPFKRMKESSGLSPITPKRNTDTCNREGNRPKAKVFGRFIRSKAKGSVVKPPVRKNVDVETIIIDDDEQNPVSPDVSHDIEDEFIPNPIEDSPPMFDKDIRVDPVVDLPVKGNTVETNLPSSYQARDMIHPMFITRLLDKIHRMEGRVTEISAHRDIVEAKNLKLKEKVDSDIKSLLCLKNHKNRLIRRILKL